MGVAKKRSRASSQTQRAEDLIFLGCNYGNKKVKGHFDKLKASLEASFPIRVCLIDREKAKGARDLWQEIQSRINECALAIFDVSGFRPNVVLELGYALATKDPEEIIVTFDERKARSNSKKPEWLLSDIGHLSQVRYKVLENLDTKLHDNISAKVPVVAKFHALEEAAKKLSPTSYQNYVDAAKRILDALRDRGGSLSDNQFDGLIRGTNAQKVRLVSLLKTNGLAKRRRGPHGRWIRATA